jgi:Carboxypeptidase regulatory-like domain
LRTISTFMKLLLILLFVSTCAVAVAQSTNTSRTKTGSIIGSVVNENGQPLSDVVISIRAFSAVRSVQMATTDSDGKFEFNGLEPVAYQIEASHNVYSLRPREEGTPNDYHIGDSVKLVMVKGGVITGTVTTRTGEPVVGVRVRVSRIADGETVKERSTDDRGVYRIYGLPSGRYVVMAGGGGLSYYADPYDTDVPTYSAASTRDTAAEIAVRVGEETANVDIRYRGEPGRTVSGTVTNVPVGQAGTFVSLVSGFDGATQFNASSFPLGDNHGFSFSGVDDGDYTIIARTFHPNGEWSLSAPQRINVRGSDVTGITLAMKGLATVSGQVLLEELKTKECGTREAPVLTETLVSAWHNQDEAAKALPKFVWKMGAPASPDAQGSLKLQNLAPGDYYFVTRFTAKSWYLQSISLTSPATKKPVDATRTWTTIKSGERVSGLKITLAEGAASLSGQVEGEALPERLFVYLVPAEKESGYEVLRFYEVPVNPDGKIAMSNLAPGRYWLLARPELTKLRLPDATKTRAMLRREAEAVKTEIELKPCQNLVDYHVKLSAQ